MSVEENKKEEFINLLNRSFRTILSYGNGGLVPMGEFIVKDVVKDEIPTELIDKESPQKSVLFILSKIDDESIQIILPAQTFLTDFLNIAPKNTSILLKSKDFGRSLKSVEQKAKKRVFEDKTLESLVDAETISLDECKASYLINGEIQSSNYSICPVQLGWYKEKEKEKEI